MSDEPGTQAEQSLAWLATDRRRGQEALRANAAHIPRLAHRLDDQEYLAHGDIVTAGLREMTDRLFLAVGGPRVKLEADLKRLFVAGLPDEDAATVFTRFADGSGRVLISDGVLGLLYLLGTLTATWYFGFGRKRWNSWRADIKRVAAIRREGEVDQQTRVLVAALRWNFIHRRAWGNSATLAVETKAEPAESYAELCSQLALVFILAHETGHFVLGHGAAEVGSFDAELAADAFASEATHRYLTVTEDAPACSLVLTAARLALMVADVVERALFVRPPVTHPAAKTRWDKLVETGQEPRVVMEAQVMTMGLAKAIELAANPRFAMPPEWWTTAYAHPSVQCDVHGSNYYQNMSFLDRLSFGDPEDPARMLQVWADNGDLDALTAALLGKRAGLAPALRALGVSETEALDAADGVLSYHTLVEIIHGTPIVAAAPTSTIRRAAAIATATLVGGVHKGVLT